MIYTLVQFDHGCARVRLESLLCGGICPYLWRKGIGAWLLCGEAGLARKEYWLAMPGDKGSPEVFLAALLSRDDEGARLAEELSSAAVNIEYLRVRDIEPGVPWFSEGAQLYHVECFKSVVEAGRLEEFFLERCLPYWRERTLKVRILRAAEPRDATFWLSTELARVGSIDEWPALAAGAAEGRELLDRLDVSIDHPRASILRVLCAAPTERNGTAVRRAIL